MKYCWKFGVRVFCEFEEGGLAWVSCSAVLTSGSSGRLRGVWSLGTGSIEGKDDVVGGGTVSSEGMLEATLCRSSAESGVGAKDGILDGILKLILYWSQSSGSFVE